MASRSCSRNLPELIEMTQINTAQGALSRYMTMDNLAPISTWGPQVSLTPIQEQAEDIIEDHDYEEIDLEAGNPQGIQGGSQNSKDEAELPPEGYPRGCRGLFMRAMDLIRECFACYGRLLGKTEEEEATAEFAVYHRQRRAMRGSARRRDSFLMRPIRRILSNQ